MNSISETAQNFLNRANNLPTKYLNEFMRAHSSKKYDYIVLIEGNDQPYYINPCRTYLQSEKIYFLRCNGKNNVIETIEIIENSKNADYQESCCFGIVDKDYGVDPEILFPNRIYETPTYSYENFYISLDCFTAILESHFNIKEFNDFEDDYIGILSNFNQRLFEFINIVKEVDKFYRATQISKKKLKENLPKFSSDNISLSPIKVCLTGIGFQEGKSIQDCFKSDISSHYTTKSLDEASIYYNNDDISYYCNTIRGKFLVGFFVEYLKCLVNDFNNLDNPICFKSRNAIKKHKLIESQYIYKLHLSFDNATILSNFAQYANQPVCLKNFLIGFRDSKTS